MKSTRSDAQVQRAHAGHMALVSAWLKTHTLVGININFTHTNMCGVVSSHSFRHTQEEERPVEPQGTNHHLIQLLNRKYLTP